MTVCDVICALFFKPVTDHKPGKNFVKSIKSTLRYWYGGEHILNSNLVTGGLSNVVITGVKK